MNCVFNLQKKLFIILLILFSWTTYASADNMHVTDDAEISSARSNGNYGKSGRMTVKNSRSDEYQSFIRLDLTPISSGATIDKATLRLFVKSVSDAGFVDIILVEQPWSEATLRVRNAPNLGSLIATSPLRVQKSDVGKWITFDVTASVVQNWLNNPSSNFGLAILANNSESVNVTFGTKECTSTSHYTELEVELTAVGLAGATGPTGATGATGVAGATGLPGAAGATGSIGLTGAVGPIGATGVAGPQGSGGTLGYGYVYNITAQTVAVDASVIFDNNGPLMGITHGLSTNSILVVNAGTYAVTFSVTGTESNQFGIFINGAPSPSTIYGSGAGTQQNTGQAILILGEGDIITLVNHSSAAAVGLASVVGGTQANVNASVLLLRLN